MSVTIRSLGFSPSGESFDFKEDLAEATNVLHEAFHKQYFKSDLGGDASLVGPFIRTHLTAGIIGGEVHVAEFPEVGIVGVTLWFGPG
ncbi:hypothetical protein M422DRAFT_252499 [Sphaerobolus stellatus SS14]|uniref:Uncharacterized protein n=1 Tax=Sphaerobolus stellatus (strain SS14) TaxID=990650 RepID=A0A0C9VZM6_SPHS4|nr:hypothetical protein M422DRAFT_252499 [Sphaerobolus stellatus SS14]